MCKVSRSFNSKMDYVRIINSEMPYKIIMNMDNLEYSFECFDEKNIIVTPSMEDSYDLGAGFKRFESRYNLSDKTIGDFISACNLIYLNYILG